ncbi:MAG TPA: FAD-dependent oxidoreductase [Acidimicrobiia bacterium]|jgi:sarcosine oxidase|nr:FAD-dependent oxidoreductase [Acidimicrobiia bacterium]HIL46374.1 FAD-dependent oxidoreductase [Acidimicrobiia bacterium]
MFDVVVVGGGIIGASATRHLAQSGASVAVIAPPEPATPETHTGPFGAFHDVSRLSRKLYLGEVETELSRRTEAAQPIIERFSDTQVFSGPAHLFVSRPQDDEGLARAVAALPPGHGVEVRDAVAMAQRWPEISFPADMVGFLEPGTGGALDPRALVAAQLNGARASDAQVFGFPAIGLDLEQQKATVTLADGQTVTARKALVATGAWSNLSGLLPRPVALRRKTEMVLLAELDAPEAQRLANLPVMHYVIDHPAAGDIYTVAPITYPDGRTMLKWGTNTTADRWIDTEADINAWYRSGDSDRMVEALRSSIEATYPGLRASAWHTQRCVITYTTHAMPYIDVLVPDLLYSAIGGNGRSAKWADPLGQLAASLTLNGKWVDDLPAERFSVDYTQDPAIWEGRDLLCDRKSNPSG